MGAHLKKYLLYTFRGRFLPYFLLSLCPMGGDERTSFSRTPDTTTSSFSLFFFSCPRGTPSSSSLPSGEKEEEERKEKVAGEKIPPEQHATLSRNRAEQKGIYEKVEKAIFFF